MPSRGHPASPAVAEVVPPRSGLSRRPALNHTHLSLAIPGPDARFVSNRAERGKQRESRMEPQFEQRPVPLGLGHGLERQRLHGSQASPRVIEKATHACAEPRRDRILTGRSRHLRTTRQRRERLASVVQIATDIERERPHLRPPNPRPPSRARVRIDEDRIGDADGLRVGNNLGRARGRQTRRCLGRQQKREEGQELPHREQEDLPLPPPHFRRAEGMPGRGRPADRRVGHGACLC